MWKSNINYKT